MCELDRSGHTVMRRLPHQHNFILFSLSFELLNSSFICQNNKTSTEYISSLFNETDNLASQETCLVPGELNLPYIFSDDIDAFSVSAMKISEKSHIGLSFGGIFFIWKRISVNLFPLGRTTTLGF